MCCSDVKRLRLSAGLVFLLVRVPVIVACSPEVDGVQELIVADLTDCPEVDAVEKLEVIDHEVTVLIGSVCNGVREAYRHLPSKPILREDHQVFRVDASVAGQVTALAAPEAAVGCKPMVGKDAEVGKVGISISVEIPDDELPGQVRLI